MYTKVSIPKPGAGAGTAVPKDPTIIIIDVEDIAAEPTREVGNTLLKGDYTLKEGAKAIGIYATPNTISLTEEFGGEADAKGVKSGVIFSHPGNSPEIKGFDEAFLNKGVVILIKDCDGTKNGRYQAVGSKCNPLFMTVETTNNNEATKRQHTFKQELNSPFLAGDYVGVIPALASENQNPEGA